VDQDHPYSLNQDAIASESRLTWKVKVSTVRRAPLRTRSLATNPAGLAASPRIQAARPSHSAWRAVWRPRRCLHKTATRFSWSSRRSS